MSVKRILVIVAVTLSCAACSFADLNWYNQATGLITDFDGSALANSQSDYTVGCFAQLIQASSAAAPVWNGSDSQGIQGTETVVGQNYSCQGTVALPAFAGLFPEQNLSTSQSGYYYVRVFNAPQADATDWGNAIVPTAATHYWESEVYSYTYSMSPTDWDFTTGSGDLTTSHAIVPEPTTFAFLGLGAVAFFVRKRMRT